MRTAILCTCIYILYGKTLVCVCVLCVRARYLCWLSRFVFCPLFSSLVLLYSIATPSKNTYTHTMHLNEGLISEDT